MELPRTPFTTADAAGLGLRQTEMRKLLQLGELRRPFRGVYCRGDLPDTLELRAQCAALILPAHVVLIDRTAAWLHGVDCLQYAETRFLPRLEVASTEGLTGARKGVYSGQRALCRDEVMHLHQVPVTTPVRTAVDLACLRGGPQALAAVEAIMRACDLTTVDLRRQVVRHRGRRGVVQARALVEVASPMSESPGESFTKWCILDAGLPAPEQQWIVVDLEGWGVVQLDFAYPELKIAVEYDGKEFHGAKQRRHDRKRRRALRAAGWKVIVVRAEDLALPTREQWLGELGDALAQRAPVHRRTFPTKQLVQ